MPTVYIPALLHDLTGGRASVDVEGATIRQLIDNLERLHPGIRERLLDKDGLRLNVRVAIDGRLAPLGLLARPSPSSEVHFITAVSGGAAGWVPAPGRPHRLYSPFAAQSNHASGFEPQIPCRQVQHD